MSYSLVTRAEPQSTADTPDQPMRLLTGVLEFLEVVSPALTGSQIVIQGAQNCDPCACIQEHQW
jgi:hypothetical protein